MGFAETLLLYTPLGGSDIVSSEWVCVCVWENEEHSIILDIAPLNSVPPPQITRLFPEHIKAINI